MTDKKLLYNGFVHNLKEGVKMSVNQHYHTWNQKLTQLFPRERVTRIRNLAWLIAGIFASKSVNLSRVASKIPGTVKLTSITRRLDRFLENKAVRVRDWYEPTIKQLLEQRKNQCIRLLVDGSKVGSGHQLLMVSLAYRSRSIPLVWMWVRHARGHSSSGRQLALLSYLRTIIPATSKVLLVGDSEFGSIELLKTMDEWHWNYVLRQKGNHLVRENGKSAWKPFREWIEKAGQSVWLGAQQLTQQHAYTVNLLAHWKQGEKEPWLLATNLPSMREALRAYKYRMWIEEMFGDFKDNGFDLEATRLRHCMKLHRLTFAVVLIYLDLLTAGSKAIKNGQRHLVDRRDRKDLSVFRVGLYMRERHLANTVPFSLALFPVL
jgi:hypothetical protein